MHRIQHCGMNRNQKHPVESIFLSSFQISAIQQHFDNEIRDILFLAVKISVAKGTEIMIIITYRTALATQKPTPPG